MTRDKLNQAKGLESAICSLNQRLAFYSAGPIEILSFQFTQNGKTVSESLTSAGITHAFFNKIIRKKIELEKLRLRIKIDQLENELEAL